MNTVPPARYPDKPDNGTGVLCAADLRARGLALCRPDPGEKKPTYPGWPTRSLEATDFGGDSLFGILTGPLSDCNRPGHALVVPDLDLPAAVQKADDHLPPTAMMDGRPGKPNDHRYFLIPLNTIPEWAHSHAPQASAAAKKAKGHPGPFKKKFQLPDKTCVIDFMGTGGQVVCPSPGNQRRWAGGVPGEPAVVPFTALWDAVCGLAVACGCLPPFAAADGRVHRLMVKATPDKIARARAYVRKMRAAVSGQGGHDATFEVAQVLVRGFDLTVEQAWPILEEFNRRCQPPWSDDELAHKLNDADKHSRLPRGYLLDTDREAEEVHLTDLGNARRVVKRHGADLRHVHPWKNWLVWDGRRWAEDQTAEVVRRVKETQGSLYRWAAEEIVRLDRIEDKAERAKRAATLNAVLAHALKWEDARAISRCLELAKSESGVPAVPGDMDKNPWLLNVQNGTLDLRTGQLRPHRREDLITRLAPVVYDPMARCPLWERSLGRWMDDNGDLTIYLQRVVGYGLTGDVSEQSLWFLHGDGSNGKSTFLMTLLAMLGDYAMQAVADLLMVKHHESHPTERADLFGKRFVATIETEEGRRMAEALMKQLTGGDKVRARKMRKDFFEFEPTHKIVLAANHKPQVRGADHAVWRRIKLVPFTVTIPPEEKDKALPGKLRAELPGILAWAVRGCLDWQRYGLAEPNEVRQATRSYQREQDVICTFVSECCNLRTEAKVKVSALFEAYGKWSGDKFTTQPAFNERMRAMGFEAKRSATGYLWHGLTLDYAGPRVGASEPE
jgi:P4 family phage/plasmid primase-like protien